MSAHPFRQARYSVSAHYLDQLPADAGVEVAFAGRSNAGKSSALNAITDHNRLAHTSKTPGRTQQLNVFVLDEPGRRLIDLPGYGYAKVPPAMREHWRDVIDRYLHTRHSLKGLVLIMDIRHPLREFDQLMLQFCADIGLPCHALLTKADKLSRNQGAQAVAAVRRELKAAQSRATVQLFSSEDKTGVHEARTVLAGWLGLLEKSTHEGAPKG